MQTTLKLIDFLLVAPMLSIFLASLVPIGLKVFKRKNQESRADFSIGVALIGVSISLVILILFHGKVFFEGTFYAFSQALVFDRFTFFSTALCQCFLY